ncbi:hypothetical protein L7F22_004663 [Adiantum nelumboides]|nr:hypothetical protein [Adiantum nelumboides]
MGFGPKLGRVHVHEDLAACKELADVRASLLGDLQNLLARLLHPAARSGEGEGEAPLGRLRSQLQRGRRFPHLSGHRPAARDGLVAFSLSARSAIEAAQQGAAPAQAPCSCMPLFCPHGAAVLPELTSLFSHSQSKHGVELTSD